jgi:hypothetical protein
MVLHEPVELFRRQSKLTGEGFRARQRTPGVIPCADARTFGLGQR